MISVTIFLLLLLHYSSNNYKNGAPIHNYLSFNYIVTNIINFSISIQDDIRIKCIRCIVSNRTRGDCFNTVHVNYQIFDGTREANLKLSSCRRFSSRRDVPRPGLVLPGAEQPIDRGCSLFLSPCLESTSVIIQRNGIQGLLRIIHILRIYLLLGCIARGNASGWTRGSRRGRARLRRRQDHEGRETWRGRAK